MWEWVPVDGSYKRFITTDLLRWEEGDFDTRRKRRGKALCIGRRQITAEVLGGPDEKGCIQFLVRGCRVTADEMIGRQVKVIKPGTVIPRTRAKVLRGKPERLVWTDESARAVVSSKFIGPPLDT